MYDNFQKRQFRKNFDEFIARKCPVLTDYQYADDYVKDSISYYICLKKIGNINPDFLDLRKHRLMWYDMAKLANLPTRDRWFDIEIEKERENGIF